MILVEILPFDGHEILEQLHLVVQAGAFVVPSTSNSRWEALLILQVNSLTSGLLHAPNHGFPIDNGLIIRKVVLEEWFSTWHFLNI